MGSDTRAQVELAETLIKNAIIAVPPQTWNINLADAQDPQERDPSEEELLVFRLGFNFLAYRVDYWWWESVEVGIPTSCDKIGEHARRVKLTFTSKFLPCLTVTL